MYSRFKVALFVLAASAVATSAVAADAPFKKGDKLQTLSNLHPDMNKRVMFAINYQLASIIPVCTDVVVKKVSGSKLVFTWQDTEYEFANDKYTKGADVPFEKVLQTFFGPACDKAKMDSLSQVDREGIASGRPAVGMSRDGVLFAMGRPPFHANPSLDVGQWMYWKNRFGKTAVEFGSDNKVKNVR